MNKLNNVPVIYKFIKGKHGTLKGCILATANGIGWSLACHKRNDCQMTIIEDKFNKQRAIEIAFGRAEKGCKDALPHSVKPHFEEMTKRASKYFKPSDSVKE